jgi:hypothetical protein
LNKKKSTIIYRGLLYIGQGSFKIGSKEMIHYVKEAKKEALKTVERFTAKKINCLTTTFFEPFKLAKGSFLIVN